MDILNRPPPPRKWSVSYKKTAFETFYALGDTIGGGEGFYYGEGFISFTKFKNL
jgi:hypothetical protein